MIFVCLVDEFLQLISFVSPIVRPSGTLLAFYFRLLDVLVSAVPGSSVQIEPCRLILK